MTVITTLLSIFWIYGGAYFAALAIASSFYAAYFFFWTRTGDRIGKIDEDTKKIYLHSIYKVLRFSLYMIILSKIVEIGIITTLAKQEGLNVNIFDIFLSQNGAFIYTLLILLVINSVAMQKRWINFSFGFPFAIVSYFFLFLHMTSRSTFSGIEGYFVPGGELLVTDVFIYLVALIFGTMIFNYFSGKVLDNTKETK